MSKANDPTIKAQITRYGFTWGPMIVERASSDPRHGVWLHIRTGKQLLTVRATRSGLLRVGDVEKDWHDGRSGWIGEVGLSALHDQPLWFARILAVRLLHHEPF